MLFSTLDTTTRSLTLPDGQEILLTDTVGFINKLPHHLIDAFRSTLEEARYADYILHVVDTSNPQMELQMQVVYDTLRELKVEDKKIVTLLNKQDKLLAPMGGNDSTDPRIRNSARRRISAGRHPRKSLCTEGYLSEGIEVWQAGLKTAVHPFKRRTAPKNGMDRT